MTSVIDVIHDKIQSTKVYKPRKGVIIAVRAQTALVRPVGSATTVPCAFDPQQGVEVDKVCTYIWVQGRKEYVIQSVFSPKSTILSPDQNKTAFELSPPSNLVHDDSLPGCVLLIWDCPPQQDITFEVMYNSSAAEASAQTMRTRAGTAVIPTVDDPTYFRIRSVTEDWKYSSWTEWGSESPGTGAPGGGDSDAIHDNVSGEIHAITEKTTPIAADEIVIEDSASSYAKKRVQLSNAGKAIKLDDLATPDDNTDLNATSSYHGLLPKLSGNSSQVLLGDGTFGASPGGSGGNHDLFSQYTITEIDGSTSETEMMHASGYIGSKTLAANFFIAGKALEIEVLGGFHTDTTAGNLTIKFKLDTGVAFTLTIDQPDNISFGYVWLKFRYVCLTTGASGSFRGFAEIRYSNGSDGSIVHEDFRQYSGSAINTTTSHDMHLTMQEADADDTISVNYMTVKYVDPS